MNYKPLRSLMTDYKENVRSNIPPIRWAMGSGKLSEIIIGPNRVVVLGGIPGVGKTALIMQLVFDGLLLNPELKVLVCNVEMPTEDLLDRQLARLSQVPLTTIINRKIIEASKQNIEHGLRGLDAVADRVCFLDPPFTWEQANIAQDAFNADLIVMDYLQQIQVPSETTDPRAAASEAMAAARQLAFLGKGVIVVSALNRGEKGKYEDSNISSFRDSSSIEYGADDAWILLKDEALADNEVTLKHVKKRHNETGDIYLRFEGQFQRFRCGTGKGLEGVKW